MWIGTMEVRRELDGHTELATRARPSQYVVRRDNGPSVPIRHHPQPGRSIILAQDIAVCSYSMSEKRTCPCKRLPLSLSSFTAAEYGDLHRLSRSGPATVHRTDAGGFTPLYYAAQNNHVAATCLLLELGADPDGAPSTCGATPLHRASYAGAVAAMRVLLDHRCELLARDTSFGDKMMPLHKAVAGGRYLAVQLLLDALRAAHGGECQGVQSGNGQQPLPILHQVLTARDSLGRTPLQVAVALSQVQEQERKSVERWDGIAGGIADWDRCVQMLRVAVRGIDLSNNFDNRPTASTLQPLPPHLTARATMSCLDCNANDDGCCSTLSWEIGFRSLLLTSAERSWKEDMSSSSVSSAEWKGWETPGSSNRTTLPMKIDQATTGLQQSTGVAPCVDSGKAADQSALGRSCAKCGALSFALFPEGQELVCRLCVKPPRQRLCSFQR